MNECLKVPKNKVWSNTVLKFVCQDEYYELRDGSCEPLGQNERYVYEIKGFVCKSGYYRFENDCIGLPANSYYSEES